MNHLNEFYSGELQEGVRVRVKHNGKIFKADFISINMYYRDNGSVKALALLDPDIEIKGLKGEFLVESDNIHLL